MSRTTLAAFVLLGALTVATASMAQNGARTIVVKRDPGCTCCLKWVAHLKQAGFAATVTEDADMAAVKDARGVPDAARSCHTGTIDGYVIEGHVPAEDIARLLTQRPAVAGLAVAGMPSGAPGMEAPGGRLTPYDVLAFDKSGKTSVFASHR